MAQHMPSRVPPRGRSAYAGPSRPIARPPYSRTSPASSDDFQLDMAEDDRGIHQDVVAQLLGPGAERGVVRERLARRPERAVVEPGPVLAETSNLHLRQDLPMSEHESKPRHIDGQDRTPTEVLDRLGVPVLVSEHAWGWGFGVPVIQTAHDGLPAMVERIEVSRPKRHIRVEPQQPFRGGLFEEAFGHTVPSDIQMSHVPDGPDDAPAYLVPSVVDELHEVPDHHEIEVMVGHHADGHSVRHPRSPSLISLTSSGCGACHSPGSKEPSTVP